MYKVVLITSGQPSLNPRLVKEADALSDAGHQVIVLYAYWNEWGTAYDTNLIANSKWSAIRVGGSPNNGRLSYLATRVMHKIARAYRFPALAEIGLSRSTFLLIREAKKHRADLYIAHNLGALPAAVVAAKKHGKPCGFDAEDFHRNETSNNKKDADVIRKTIVENKYIPQLNYFTASSPQIASEYQKLFPQLDPVVILNVFRKQTVNLSNPAGALKLFWFSQTVGAGRGIEDVINAMALLKKEDFELHLLGSRPSFSQNFIEILAEADVNVTYHDPIPPEHIISFAAQFDIGLALETNEPLNRDICLTNKLFTYMQAGLAVIASQTTAQSDFMVQNRAIGDTYPIGDASKLADILTSYKQDREKLMARKEASLKLAQDRFNWETESRKFLRLIKEII